MSCYICGQKAFSCFDKKCPIDICAKTYSYCSLDCSDLHYMKLTSCGGCGLLSFCEHGMPGGSICTALIRDGFGDYVMCGDNLCIACSKLSSKRYNRYFCAKHGY